MRRGRRAPARYWDAHFVRWIAQGEAEGVDPNDIGDREWGSPRRYVEERFLPWVRYDWSVVQHELGWRRLTRRQAKRAQRDFVRELSGVARRLAPDGRFCTYATFPASLLGSDGGG